LESGQKGKFEILSDIRDPEFAGLRFSEGSKLKRQKQRIGTMSDVNEVRAILEQKVLENGAVSCTGLNGIENGQKVRVGMNNVEAARELKADQRFIVREQSGKKNVDQRNSWDWVCVNVQRADIPVREERDYRTLCLLEDLA